MRFFLSITYNGQFYSGWQIQENSKTVQERLNYCLSKLLREEITSYGSGRTDAGVHCLEQFVHFDTTSDFDPQVLTRKLNAFLEKHIRINGIYRVKDDAHARFSALTRTYRYYISTQKDPFFYQTSATVDIELDLELMNQACETLKSNTNFKCFCKSKSQNLTYICKITEAKWYYNHQNFLVFEVTANRFLRGMVRALVGTLLEVGKGNKPVSWVQDLINSEDRKLAGDSAPAQGLFLECVTYSDDIFVNQKPTYLIN